MADLDLDAIKARSEAATSGPWVIGNSVLEVRGAHDSGIQRPWVADAQDEDDADFIANARTDVPVLVAEVERQAAIIAKSREVAEHWRGSYMQGIAEGSKVLWAIGTHPLGLVLAALDGETDPLNLGMPAQRSIR